MGLMDRLRGRRPEEDAASTSGAAVTDVPAAQPSLDLTEAPAPTLSAPSAGFDVKAQDAARLYNPYEGVRGPGVARRCCVWLGLGASVPAGLAAVRDGALAEAVELLVEGKGPTRAWPGPSLPPLNSPPWRGLVGWGPHIPPDTLWDGARLRDAARPPAGLGAAMARREGSAPGFRLPKEPEFLFSEEANVRHRSWSENLTYYTGAGYLAGALLGGGKGAAQALSSPLAVEGVGSSQRLRVNQLLNASGKLGRANGESRRVGVGGWVGVGGGVEGKKGGGGEEGGESTPVQMDGWTGT